ncbi:response regulator transcription factor [Methyloferula stellata]|uniref:response regulator transcription factor n=1 Tax=Methyloferula stellata TaxID=876270 RepID=UPI001FCACE08|nr:response regulator transcription factor [Methyloferula stellata]
MELLKNGRGMHEQIKVLVVEDHPIVRDGCQRILNRREDLDMIAASSAQAGLILNREFLPPVIVLDVGLPDASGFDIISELLGDNPEAKIIIFSMYETASFVTAALEKGASGYITKNDDPDTILMAIDKVRAGSVYLGQAVAQTLVMVNLSLANDPLRALNDRERQIVVRLGDGKSLTEISIELVLGYKTVANAVASIKQKLKIPTSSALIKFAVELRSKM